VRSLEATLESLSEDSSKQPLIAAEVIELYKKVEKLKPDDNDPRAKVIYDTLSSTLEFVNAALFGVSYFYSEDEKTIIDQAKKDLESLVENSHTLEIRELVETSIGIRNSAFVAQHQMKKS